MRARESDVLGDLRPHRIWQDHLVAGREQSAEGCEERVHRTVGDEDVVGVDAVESVEQRHLLGECGAQLRDAVVGDVVSLAGVRGGDYRVDHVGSGCEAGIAGFESEDSLAFTRRDEESLAELNDLAG